MLLLPRPIINWRACMVTCPAIIIRLLITVRKRRRLTSLFWRGARPPIVPWPIIRRMLYAIIPNSSISALVANFPDGSRSRSMSVFTSLWNCSHSPWAWYRLMISSSGSPRFVHQVSTSISGTRLNWPYLSMVRSVISYPARSVYSVLNCLLVTVFQSLPI